ncbi:MAG: hypothetical protein GY869_18260, partial [Planctomycetes bacterium]|nr:hypothetical protein [Planctomycetota bacterium]
MKYKNMFQVLIAGVLLVLFVPPVFAQISTFSNNFITANGALTSSRNNFAIMTLTIGQPLVGKKGYCANGSGEFGFWSRLKVEPNSPIVMASDGAYPDKVLISWVEDPLSPSAQEGFKLFREGELLGTFGFNVDEYQDFNIMAGQFYTYGVLGINQYGEGSIGEDIGFVNPNGVITGLVQTSNGRAVPDVDVSLTPRVGAALEFDGVDDYVAVKDFFYETTGEIEGITVEAWVKTTATNEVIVASWDR